MDKEASGFNTKQTVAIVGLGLIGGSYARGLRRIGVGHIIAIDPDEKALQQAKQEGMVDEIYTAGSKALKQADLVIFCTAADVMIRFLAENKAFFAPGAVLTDVAGIKGDTATAIPLFSRKASISCPVTPWQAVKAGGMPWPVPIYSTVPIIYSSPWRATTKTISGV